MEQLGININLLMFQLIVAFVIVALPIISLFHLGIKKRLTGMTLALWVLIICIIPFLGPLAYWIIKPTDEGDN